MSLSAILRRDLNGAEERHSTGSKEWVAKLLMALLCKHERMRKIAADGACKYCKTNQETFAGADQTGNNLIKY